MNQFLSKPSARSSASMPENEAPSMHPGPAAQLPLSGPQKKKTRLLLMGQKRSGKTSISLVVFGKMPPSETLFLEPTISVLNSTINSFADFDLWDFPGQSSSHNLACNPKDIIKNDDIPIWIIDAQADYFDSLCQLHSLIIAVRQSHPKMSIEVFIHKIDGLSDDHKLDVREDIIRRTQDALDDNDLDDAHISYHFTSIYDHSILEALSKVIQKFIPHLHTVEELLDHLCHSSGIHKAFLFDATNKIYIATDSSPVDLQVFETCIAHLDFVEAMSNIYGTQKDISELNKNKTLEISKEVNGLTQVGSTMKLETGLVLHFKGLDRSLALACLMREECSQKLPMIALNIEVFRKSLQKVFDHKVVYPSP